MPGLIYRRRSLYIGAGPYTKYNPPAVIGVGGSILPLARAHPLRKPAAEAEAETGQEDVWDVWETSGNVSRTSPRAGQGVPEGGAAKGSQGAQKLSVLHF